MNVADRANVPQESEMDRLAKNPVRKEGGVPAPGAQYSSEGVPEAH